MVVHLMYLILRELFKIGGIQDKERIDLPFREILRILKLLSQLKLFLENVL